MGRPTTRTLEEQKENRREYARKYYQKYNRTHKEDVRRRKASVHYRYTEVLQNVKRKDYDCSLTEEEYAVIIKDGLCHYCGKELQPTGGGIDRKDSNKGYIAENCVPCCKRCNFTFNNFYDYDAKMILSEAIRKIDSRL